jgi:hypothetical protein
MLMMDKYIYSDFANPNQVVIPTAIWQKVQLIVLQGGMGVR